VKLQTLNAASKFFAPSRLQREDDFTLEARRREGKSGTGEVA
jgi:hypothetical protein